MITDHFLALACLEVYPESGEYIDAPKKRGRLRWDTEYLEIKRIPEYSRSKVFAICGSEKDLRDWVRNFLAVPWYDSSCGWVHLGWLLAARRMAKHIAATKGFYSVVITGHSLGGSVAILTAQILDKKYGIKVDRAVTFGAPRPFFRRRPDYRFAVICYEGDQDEVTKIPSFNVPASYSPVKLVGIKHKMSGYVEKLEG